MEVSQKNGQHCLACGKELDSKSRKYCSRSCKVDLLDSLSLIEPLLLQLKAVAAALFFSKTVVVLDIQLKEPEGVVSFRRPKLEYEKPSEKFSRLAMELNSAWHSKNTGRYSKINELISFEGLKEGSVIENSSTGSILKSFLSNELNEFNFKQEVKSAFRKASLKLHPDHGGSVNMFQVLKDEYETALSSPSSFLKRQKFAARGRWIFFNKKWQPPIVE